MLLLRASSPLLPLGFSLGPLVRRLGFFSFLSAFFLAASASFSAFFLAASASFSAFFLAASASFFGLLLGRFGFLFGLLLGRFGFLFGLLLGRFGFLFGLALLARLFLSSFVGSLPGGDSGAGSHEWSFVSAIASEALDLDERDGEQKRDAQSSEARLERPAIHLGHLSVLLGTH